tara:strand:+ start:466 stop:642 length:177 start_codon:yes stop_codon:yes gene_type:complete
MNITSAQYQQSSEESGNDSIKATIDGEVWVVGIDPANRHYAEIMRQVEAGTLTIKDAE